MGAIYRLVNLDKKEYVSISAKWAEWDEKFLGAVIKVLITRRYVDDDDEILGRWAGDRIVFCSEYDEECEAIVEESRDITPDVVRYAIELGVLDPDEVDPWIRVYLESI